MATLLVVEDDRNQRLLYQQELEEDGYTVLTAESGREALKIVGETKPDLVILDISMPCMDGIETMGKILGRDHAIPVILNTAYATYKDNFMSWSADAYVVKTSDMGELKDKIKEILEARGKKK